MTPDLSSSASGPHVQPIGYLPDHPSSNDVTANLAVLPDAACTHRYPLQIGWLNSCSETPETICVMSAHGKLVFSMRVQCQVTTWLDSCR
jgi:hypothetical protein